MLFSCNACKCLLEPEMQTRTESAIQGHCNLAHIYQPLCQHWLTNTRYLAHWKICAAPQLHNVGLWGNHKLFQQANQSQHNRSTAMQWEGAPLCALQQVMHKAANPMHKQASASSCFHNEFIHQSPLPPHWRNPAHVLRLQHWPPNL